MVEQGKRAILRMKQPLLIGQTVERTMHNCEILEYDKTRECLSLRLKNGSLTNLSLDAIYECVLESEEGFCSCEGRIVARGIEERGQVVVLGVKSGFYKITINNVDK